jgi:hypothetical protein
MKSSFNSLSLSLSLFCNCQFRGLNSVTFLCSQPHILEVWRLETRLPQLPCSAKWLQDNSSARTTQKTQPLLLRRRVSSPLHSNESYSIIACVFFVAGLCLLSRYVVMNVYSDFAVPAFWRHITIL